MTLLSKPPPPVIFIAMEDLLYVEDEYEYYTESEVEADGEEEEDDDDETIKNVPIRSACRLTSF